MYYLTVVCKQNGEYVSSVDVGPFSTREDVVEFMKQKQINAFESGLTSGGACHLADPSAIDLQVWKEDARDLRRRYGR